MSRWLSPIANVEVKGALSVKLPISPQVGEMPNFGKEGRTEGGQGMQPLENCQRAPRDIISQHRRATRRRHPAASAEVCARRPPARLGKGACWQPFGSSRHCQTALKRILEARRVVGGVFQAAEEVDAVKFALFAYDNAGFSKHILNCLVGHIHAYPPLQRHGSIARLCNRLVAAIDQCATTTILGQHGA
ncbi:hypothetical protein [Mesorhizobium sp.]|uniref:hypothetical protein n=1 Tax=Mesorhizobium sp. TaxID=1871066 RepID=UPI00257BD6C8|nr:hypothetical protein [Mesorhizobium sp.]